MRIILFLLFLLPLSAAAESKNAGFVQGLWYDRDQLFADEEVRVYVAIRNYTGAEMTGTVTFYVDDNVLTRKSITALNERIVESWADWIPPYGEHTVRAELSRLEISTVDGEEERLTVTAPLAEDILFIDRDTDKDGLGDKVDDDDDNDGVSDEAEVEAGTDPFTPDKPQEHDAEEASNDDRRTDSDKQSNKTEVSTTPAGLEQYLTPSRADLMLSSITDWTNETKERVDDYREQRSYETAVATNDPELEVDDSGFGAVVRETNANEAAQKPEGFLGGLITLISTILYTLVSALLAFISIAFSYPILIQVSLLLFLLYVIYRFARKFGSRPS